MKTSSLSPSLLPRILDSTSECPGIDNFGKTNASIDRACESRLQLGLPAQQFSNH